MSEPSVASFAPGVAPNLNSNIVNQKSFTVNGTHNSVIQTITVSATISGITAPQYLVNVVSGEIIYAEGISGVTFTTCTRGADGTTAASMNTGDVLRPVISANLYNQLVRELKAIAPYVYNADPTVIRQIASQEAMRFRIDTSKFASLNGSSLVVENPANATATPTASKIPISDVDGKLNENWVNSGDLLLWGRVFN